MKTRYLITSTGFAMFSMFFGSGNLIFPLTVGKESGGHFLLATLGILLTGVLVPFIGVLGMMLFKGDSKSFFGSLGKQATLWVPLVILGLMGPFGVLARCITVAHGNFHLLFPSVTLPVFSLLSCGIIYLLTMKKNRIVPFLGSVLTPFLLLSLGSIALFGFWYGSTPTVSSEVSLQPLLQGALQGYQTMDLLAAFFFSTFVITHLQSRCEAEGEEKSIFKIFFKSTLVGGGLLGVIYFGLVYLGSVYASSLVNVPPQEMLGVVAYKALGPLSTPIVCATVVLACFTTAVVLATLFADFLQTDVARGKMPERLAMLVTLGIAFGISTLEFAGIAKFLIPILDVLYPALIVLTLMNIASKLWGFQNSRWPVALTIAAKLCTL